MGVETGSDWLWDGAHMFGLGGLSLMLTFALLGLSTSYFGGIGLAFFPHMWSHLHLGLPKPQKKRTRVYMDGCFDLMHFGHANALRQAKALGDELVVGLVADEEILAYKGPPVLPMEERLALVSGIKWVDQVLANAPYAFTEDYMNSLFNDHKIDYIIHGDDPCYLPDGTDAYAMAKKAGRYKQIKRTEGVSSTDIVGRILSYVKDTPSSPRKGHETTEASIAHLSQFLPTSRHIVQFSSGKSPGPNDRAVYIDGAFDLFHAGHVEALRRARQLGDFLLVGIHNDQIVSECRGKHYPLMNLLERCLSVLACRFVDEIIMGAPLEITKDMITTFNISLVVRGTVSESNSFLDTDSDRYKIPKSLGIFRTIESPKNITTTTVAQRIVANHEAYRKRNLTKQASEKKYYSEEKVHIFGD